MEVEISLEAEAENKTDSLQRELDLDSASEYRDVTVFPPTGFSAVSYLGCHGKLFYRHDTASDTTAPPPGREDYTEPSRRKERKIVRSSAPSTALSGAGPSTPRLSGAGPSDLPTPLVRRLIRLLRRFF
jgi:hypothetical protein